jgi:predicted  nucleic acid-binding Zn-ribbon protein
MASIDLQEIGNIEARWGVKAGDYNVTLNSKTDMMDFQDLMVKFSKNRAVAVEGEVEPLTVRIQQRNKRLEELSEVLAELTKIQAEFDSDDTGSRDMHSWMSNKTGQVLESLGYTPSYYAKESDRPKDNEERADFYKVGWNGDNSYSANKKTIEGMLSRVKSEIDGLNNEAQTDMTRLQSLVDRRDESYSTATNLMTSISDTRSNVIRNM